MSRITKTLLVLTVTGLVSGLVFVTGIVKVGDGVAWYITLPTGAIFFGLFLISKLLEKEVALYDAEQVSMLASAQKLSGATPTTPKACCQKPMPARHKSLASAH